MNAKICQLYNAGDRDAALALLLANFESTTGEPLSMKNIVHDCHFSQ